MDLMEICPELINLEANGWNILLVLEVIKITPEIRGTVTDLKNKTIELGGAWEYAEIDGMTKSHILKGP